jgi:hypothetical protein
VELNSKRPTHATVQYHQDIMPITRSTYCMTLKYLETEIADLKPLGISYIHQHFCAFLCVITRVAGVTSTRLIKNSNSNSQSLLLECMEKKLLFALVIVPNTYRNIQCVCVGNTGSYL